MPAGPGRRRPKFGTTGLIGLVPLLVLAAMACSCGTGTPAAGSGGPGGSGSALPSAPPDGRPAAAATAPRSGPVGPGYALVTAGGLVGTFGGAGFHGDLAATPPTSPVVGMAATADGRGYWLVTRAGSVTAFGDALDRHPAAPPPGAGAAVAVVAVPGGPGYWVVHSGGVVQAVSAPTLAPAVVPAGAGPVVAAAAAGRDALWLATAGGAVLTAGHPGTPVVPPHVSADRRPVVAMAATADRRGYWLAAAGGGVTSAGDAAGATVAHPAPGGGDPVTCLFGAPSGRGYLEVRTDGRVEAGGGAVNLGDGRSPLHPPLYPSFLQSAPTGAVGGAYLAAGPQAATTGPTRITVLGDSLSVILGRYTRTYVADHHLAATVAIGGIMGCGVTGDLPLGTYSDPVPPAPTLPACGQWRQQYAQALGWNHPDVVILLLGYWESQRHTLDGHTVTLASSAAYRRVVAGGLATAAAMVRSAGSRLVVLGAPLFGDGTPAGNVAAFNNILAGTARAAGAPELDLQAILDPSGRYQQAVGGVVVRTSDRVHLTARAVTTFIGPELVPLALRTARRPR